jgi:hypothetical protein
MITNIDVSTAMGFVGLMFSKYRGRFIKHQ